jgi:DNA-3-methyladenine glycosylase I
MAGEGNLRQRKAWRHADGKIRCAWCPEDPLYIAYHDDEWGRALHDERRLFEMLCLEGAQAGLSWITILRKRGSYRAAFDGFDAEKMARYGLAKRRALLNDAGIVRNRLKVDAFISNANAYLELRSALGSFDDYLWQFTGGKVLRRRPVYLSGIPASTPESDAMSKDLKQRGFRFVGSTICYAFMQAVGIVDEHQRRCWAGTGPGGPRARPQR